MNSDQLSYMQIERIVTQAKRFADSGHMGEAISRARIALNMLSEQRDISWGEESGSLQLRVREMLDRWVAVYERSRQDLEAKRLEKMRNPEKEAEQKLPPL